MAKTLVKHRTSGKKIKRCNKTLKLEARIDKAYSSDENFKQEFNLVQAMKIARTSSENDAMDVEEIILDDKAGTDWPRRQERDPDTEHEEIEMRKTFKTVPYQLQQWLFETSNLNITFAERLEKSKWKYEEVGVEESVTVGDDEPAGSRNG